MEQNYWQVGTWRGIPVAMHWTVLLICIWFYLFFLGAVPALIGSAAYLALLLIHEAGHVMALRRRRIPVEGITLYMLHGRTSYGQGSSAYDIVVAWSGIGAQAVVLLLALAVRHTLDLREYPVAAMIVSPILVVFTFVNALLMVVALLPIGPFDGHAAWQVIPYMRARSRRRAQRKRDIELNPEKGLSPERRRALEESASREAAELLGKFSKKTDGRKEDA